MDLYTAQVNKNIAKGISLAIVKQQAQVIRLRCVAFAAQTSNYADAVNVAATSLTLSLNGVADSTVGAAGVLAYATYTTLGSLVDAINLSGNWEAEIVAGLRSDLTASSVILARTTSTFRMYQEVDLLWDSNAAKHLDIVLESGKPFGAIHNSLSKGYNPHRVNFQRVTALQDTSDSSAPLLNVYQVPTDRSSSTLLASYIMTDNTAFDSGVDAPVISSDFSSNILVRLSVTGSVWSDTGARLTVFGNRE